MTPYDQKIQELKAKLGEPMSLSRNDKMRRFIEVYESRREGYLPAVADYADLVEALVRLIPEDAGAKDCDCGCEGDGEGMCDYFEALAAIAKAKGG